MRASQVNNSNTTELHNHETSQTTKETSCKEGPGPSSSSARLLPVLPFRPCNQCRRHSCWVWFGQTPFQLDLHQASISTVVVCVYVLLCCVCVCVLCGRGGRGGYVESSFFEFITVTFSALGKSHTVSTRERTKVYVCGARCVLYAV